ncbi:MAG: ATP-dependent sacrificial sulfur transferase LarE [Nitrospiria bacterium]
MLEQKFARLKKRIIRHDSLLVAFSGGVDSGLLLKVAYDLLGPRAAGCTAISPSLSLEEKESARNTAREIGAPYFIVEYDELSIPGYISNNENRCYLCKTTLFNHLIKVAKEKGFQSIAYGANHDDLNEYRPGMHAAREMSISAPLLEAELTKPEIRRLGRQLGLSIWNKPAAACLSSRIPTGSEITLQKLRQVEQAESILHGFGFNQVRVRHHDSIARIEMMKEEFHGLLEIGLIEKIVSELKKVGFKFVVLDLEGYRPAGLVPITSLYKREGL